MEESTSQFLSPEESAAVDAALLTSPEKFLARLTISSQRLLQLIAEGKGVEVAQLSHRDIIDWFEQDSKTRFEHGPEAAVLKW
ncbi:MAG: hypothetical protein AAGG02_08020 [Cyanobacteria bacterium P01_H01_bin.15]